MSESGKRAEFGRIALLYGGTAAEREVSLRSGAAVAAAMSRLQLDFVEMDLADQPLMQLSSMDIDRCFIAVHGRGGEDGTLQGALELLELPYTGSGVLASALAMDKWRTKLLWQAEGVNTPAAVLLQQDTDWQQVVDQLGGTIMVKPVREGSSIGMSRVTDAEQLRQAYLLAQQYDPYIMAEAWVQGDEFTVAILDGQPLPAIGLQTDNQFYDYDAKYASNTTRYLCPCGLDEALENTLQTLALQAYESVGCEGWGRVDVMRCQQTQEFMVLEVNTVPGMTDHSLVPMAAEVAGLSFDQLIEKLLQTTL